MNTKLTVNISKFKSIPFDDVINLDCENRLIQSKIHNFVKYIVKGNNDINKLYKSIKGDEQVTFLLWQVLANLTSDEEWSSLRLEISEDVIYVLIKKYYYMLTGSFINE